MVWLTIHNYNCGYLGFRFCPCSDDSSYGCKLSVAIQDGAIDSNPMTDTLKFLILQ